MPIFEFRCAGCDLVFESLTRLEATSGVVCPTCGGADVSRLISRFALGGQFTPCGTRQAERPPACAAGVGGGGCGSCMQQ